MPPDFPLQKTIGKAKPEVVPSLIVFNSQGASLEGGKLVLSGIAINAIIFADRLDGASRAEAYITLEPPLPRPLLSTARPAATISIHLATDAEVYSRQVRIQPWTQVGMLPPTA